MGIRKESKMSKLMCGHCGEPWSFEHTQSSEGSTFNVGVTENTPPLTPTSPPTRNIDELLKESNYVTSEDIVQIGDAFEEGDGLVWRINPEFKKQLKSAVKAATDEAVQAAQYDAAHTTMDIIGDYFDLRTKIGKQLSYRVWEEVAQVGQLNTNWSKHA